jgi:hypothetical protein
MAHRELKAQYKQLCAVVLSALSEADPIGLLALGAPADEYEPEVGTIVPRLRTATSEADVRSILLDEFTRWFSADIAGRKPERYDAAARAIWAFLESGQSLWSGVQAKPPIRRG